VSQELRDQYVNDPSNIRAAKRALKLEGNEDPTMEEIGAYLSKEFSKIPEDERGSVIGGAIGKGLKKLKKALGRNNGGMMNKRLTRTVPPKKGPNSQGMRGTGAAIRGTSFKGVF
tara:strand:+ start:307 stop:651 length:345 start_codon:yes stop_codon:yes gene_type:complete